MAEQRLPIVDGDDGQWGDVLNQFIEKEHYNTGLNDVLNGSHKTITIRPGTAAAGTAPLKFYSGPLLVTPEIGTVEFLDDRLYFTQTTNSTRKTIAAYDDASGAKGDVYYRDANANFVRLPIGNTKSVLQVIDGLPAWGDVMPAGESGQVQYNNAGELAASPNLGYDANNSRVTIGENPVVIPNNPLAMTGDVDSWLQVNLQNKDNTGTSASADYIATADNGNDNLNYADFGICNSAYANTTWDVVGPDDTYLWGDGGNVAIGTLTPNKKIPFFVANTIHEAHPADIVAEVDKDGINLPTGKTYRINGVAMVPGGASTASNIGDSGVGIYKSKVDLDFQFKKIVADSTKISVTDNTTENTVGIDIGTLALADLSDDTTHRLVTDTQLTVINNTSNTNTGDQVGDGVTITGAGTVGDPFVASIADQDLNTTDSPTFADTTLTGLSTGRKQISSSSVKTALQDLDNVVDCYSGGVVTAPTYVDNGNGTITVGSGKYNLFSQTDGTGVIKQYTVAGDTLSLTDQQENYIYVEYNGGTPRLISTTNRNLLTHTTTQTLYSIYRDGNDLIKIDWDGTGNALSNKINRRNIYTERFGVQTAPILSEVATRTVTVGSGIVWVGITNQSLDEFNSSTDTLYFLKHVSGVWTKSTVTQYNNTQYDDGTDLQTLTDGNYSVGFYYREVTSQKRVYMVLGGGDYNLANAQAATPPSGLPSYISTHTILVGRIIVQKNASSATQIDSAFTTVFASTPVEEHNQLANRDVVGNHQRLIPVSDSSTAIQITKTDGTPVMNFDTLNRAIYVAGTGSPSAAANAKFNSWDTTNGFLQTNIQNLSSGNNASADVTATNDLGDDTTHYINMGINSSAYSQAGWTINGANDGYLYVAGGNIAVGTDSNYTDIFTGGLLAANRRARFSSTGLSVTGSVTATNLSGTNTGDVDDATITITDVTTNNASTSKHGWFPKLPTPAGKFLRDDMTWQSSGGGGHTPTAVWGDNIESSSVAVGMVSYVRVPYAGTITSWSIIASASCTAVMDVWKVNAALPTVANTITASAKPSLSASATASSSTLTGWTTAVAAGDVFGFKLDSLTGTPTSITLVLNVE